MKANYRRQYVKPFTKDDGTAGRRTVYVYGVIGTKEELAHYRAVQAQKVPEGKVPVDVEPTGEETPLFFTNRLLPDNITLEITQKNNVVVLNDELSELEQLRDNDPSEFGRAALSQVIVQKQVELVRSRARANSRQVTNYNQPMEPHPINDPLEDEGDDLSEQLQNVGKDNNEEDKTPAGSGRRGSAKS